MSNLVIRFFASVLAVLICGVPADVSADDFVKAFQRGAQAYSEGRLQEALDAFRQASTIDPSNGPIHGNIGVVLYQTGRFDEALKEYREAVRLKPDFANGFLSMAYLLDRMGRDEEAVEAYGKLLSLAPKNATFRVWRSVILRQMGRLDEALADIGSALSITDSNAYAFANRAVLYERKQQPQQADADYRKAQNLDAAWPIEAARCGDDELLKRAGRHGTSVNAAAKDGTTPLMTALTNDRLTTVSTLLALGADVNARASDGTTALFVASGWGHHDAVILLLERGADLSARRVNGGTVVMSAAARGHVRTVETLLARGAAVNAKDANGGTALMIAAERGHRDTAKALLAGKGDVDAADAKGNTALFFAAYSGRTETAAVLIEKGASVNAQNREGWTPLMMAAAKGHTTAVRLLIDRGADIGVKNRDGMTAAVLAGRRGDEATFNILRQAGAREIFDFTRKEALVFGRLEFVEDGRTVDSFGLFDTPAPELYHVDTGKTLNRIQLAGLFKEAVRSDGTFCWKLPRGSYLINRINRFGRPSDDSFVYPQTAFFVPYGSDAYYLGTLRIQIATKRKLLDRTVEKVLSVEVIDHSNLSKELQAAAMPDFSGETEKNLMVHSSYFPRTIRPDPSALEQVLPFLNAFTIPLLLMK